MSISLISNFNINQNAPIDSRLVVTNSAARDAIAYKYDGLTVFKTDDRTSWIYNAVTGTWSSNSSSGGNGIYGGNGSLIGDTVVYTGSFSTTVLSAAKKFIISASSSTSAIYYSSYFNRNNTGTPGWQNIEYRMQYSHDSSTSDIAYITMNPNPPDGTSFGGIDFGTSNTRRFTITSNGIVRLWSPTYSADLRTNSLTANRTYNLPNNSGTLTLASDLASATASIYAAMNNLSYKDDFSGPKTSSFTVGTRSEFYILNSGSGVISFTVISFTGLSQSPEFNITNQVPSTGSPDSKMETNSPT
jgi:hypothetical protein